MAALSIPSASIEARLEIPEGTCVLTYQPLDVQTVIRSVGDDAAGATAVFIGTTRNSFKGRDSSAGHSNLACTYALQAR